MARALAHVEQIVWKKPIEGADRIELVGVLGWQCIAKKDEFQVGEPCVYIEIDSIVDKDNPDFAFLEKKHYKIKRNQSEKWFVHLISSFIIRIIFKNTKTQPEKRGDVGRAYTKKGRYKIADYRTAENKRAFVF